MKKKILSIFLVLTLVLHLMPTSIFAIGTQSSIPSLTVNKTKVAFAGYEWWVIGYNGQGVYSTEGDNHVTLLAKDNSFGKSAFRSGSNAQYDANPEGMSAWTKANEYAGSTLQQKMVSIASGFSTKEQNVITARDLTIASDDIKGNSISNQKLWALSANEVKKINSNNVSTIGDSWWLRNPYEGNSTTWNSVAVGGNPNSEPTYEIMHISQKSLVVRPALSLDLSSVFFTLTTTNSSVAVGSIVETPALTENDIVKFTMKDNTQKLTLIATPEQSIQTDETLTFRYSVVRETANSNEYISCILLDDTGAIKYYGKLKDISNDPYGTLNIPLNGITNGTYTLQIFSEEIKGDNYTDFCSDPVSMTVTIDNNKGTVSDFGGGIIDIPQLKIDENNKWCVSYDNGQTWISLNVKATGEDGDSPHIGNDGYWYVGDTKTSVKAKGDKGDAGITPMLKINTDNYWYVSYDNGSSWNSLDVKATGEDGDIGAQGKKGDTGLAGQNGVDGLNGKDGINGKDGKDGIGIKKAEINDNGELVITYTDGTLSNLGVVVGEDGKIDPYQNTIAIIAIVVSGLALLSNICLIIYILKKKNI